MPAPTFFLSSTIYDFHDLRSAIKFYLEQQGCLVLASEYSDFAPSLAEHSYDACLEAIGRADYYVLLIGTRVGGLVNKDQKVSITRQEYRAAYELHKRGKLKLLNFVRRQVWDYRETRNELISYLKQVAIAETEREAVGNHPTKFANDAEFISGFINEVARNQETKEALACAGDMPTNNWIYQFDTFRDVIDALRSQVFKGSPLEHAVLRKHLQSELKEIAKLCLIKSRGMLFPPTMLINGFRDNYPLNWPTEPDEVKVIVGEDWKYIRLCAAHLPAMSFGNIPILRKVLESDLMLEFSPANSDFIESAPYKLLYQLVRTIDIFKLEDRQELLRIILPRQGNDDELINVKTEDLIRIAHLFDRWDDIFALSTALLIYLKTGENKSPNLRPKSPIQADNEEFERETISDAELYQLLDEINSQ
jgi:hypothetical protein